MGKKFRTSEKFRNMKLRAFCDALEKIATTRFAAKWDNVGLLVEPAN